MTGRERTSRARTLRDYHEGRALADLVRRRVNLLTGLDRALVQMYIESSQSLRQIARLAGLNPSTVGRRIQRIIDRLADETYPLCMRYRHRFTALEIDIIRDHFARGRSIRALSRDHRVTMYRAQTTVQKARRLAESVATISIHAEESSCRRTESRRSSHGKARSPIEPCSSVACSG